MARAFDSFLGQSALVLPTGERIALSGFEHIYAVGAGKAAAAMALACEVALGERLTEGLVVTKDGHSLSTLRIDVIEASHPTPDHRSVEAGARIAAIVSRATIRDLVICLISGGASALMELPEDGVTLEDLQATTELLLRSGAPIEELNAVRACLSKLKAGGLARLAAPARVVCLLISDVLGNPLDVIGSGPCFTTARRPVEALDILQRRGLTEIVPRSVLQHLRSLANTIQAESYDTSQVDHVVLGDIDTALDAAMSEAERLGLDTTILTNRMTGEARDAGVRLAHAALDLTLQAQPPGPGCLIAGGETTVTVRGSGLGGRSQEIAVTAASLLDGVYDVALLAAGTDGTDGPTDAAGGLVEALTSARAHSAGRTAEDALLNNSSYDYLEAAGALLKTGPTNTNVGDLVIIVHAPPITPDARTGE